MNYLEITGKNGTLRVSAQCDPVRSELGMRGIPVTVKNTAV